MWGFFKFLRKENITNNVVSLMNATAQTLGDFKWKSPVTTDPNSTWQFSTMRGSCLEQLKLATLAIYLARCSIAVV